MNNIINSSLSDRKTKQIDAFGLSYQTLNSEENIDIKTPYDSFILEDTLRITANLNSLQNIKDKIKSRLDEKTGLYVITIGDVNSEYYKYATMFNRMTNKNYAQKIWRTVNLMQNILGNLKKGYNNSVSSAISQHEFRETMNREYSK